MVLVLSCSPFTETTGTLTIKRAFIEFYLTGYHTVAAPFSFPVIASSGLVLVFEEHAILSFCRWPTCQLLRSLFPRIPLSFGFVWLKLGGRLLIVSGYQRNVKTDGYWDDTFSGRPRCTLRREHVYESMT